MRFLSRLSCRSTHLLGALTLLTFSAKADSFGFTGGLQQYTVATSGVYQITADGASGASFNPYSMVGGGLGASMTGTFDLSAEEVIDVYVGQEGVLRGGGGGTFVLINGSPLPLIVAGGGGAAGLPVYAFPTDQGQNASLTTSGNSSIDDAPSGVGGSGGQAFFNLPGGSGGGGAGGGWNSNGQNGTSNGQPGFFGNGGQGFLAGSPVLAGGFPQGGYGGGGGESSQGSGGGGGGYSGGGGGGFDPFYGGAGGGGGGSYVDESALSSSAVLLTTYGDGSAEITPESASVPEPASVWLVSLSLFGIAALRASKV